MSVRDDYPAIAVLFDAWLSPAPGREQRPAPEAVRMFIELQRLRREHGEPVCSTCGGRQVVFDPKYVSEAQFCPDCGDRSRCSDSRPGQDVAS